MAMTRRVVAVRGLDFIVLFMHLCFCLGSLTLSHGLSYLRTPGWEHVDPIVQNIPYGEQHPLLQAQLGYHRNLQFDGVRDVYQNIRIGFEDRLDIVADRNLTTTEMLGHFRAEVVPRAQGFWQQALMVFPVPDGTEIGGFPSCIYDAVSGVDFVVRLDLLSSEKTCHDGTDASSRPCSVNDQWNRPLAGIVRLCPSMFEIDVEISTKILIHELGHILGVSDYAFPLYYDYETGLPRTPNLQLEDVECMDGAVRAAFLPGNSTLQETVTSEGKRYFEIVTPTVRAVARNQFNCQTLAGARLENQASSCLGHHWDNRVFQTELMATTTSVAEREITPLTLALLEDSGWYIANYSMSTVSSFGRGAGCQFLEGDCLENQVVPDYAKDFFCSMDTFFGCIPSRERWNICDIRSHDKQLPEDFQRFSDPHMGGRFPELELCPALLETSASVISKETETKLNSKSCTDVTNNVVQGQFPRVSEFEVYGSDSRCFQSNADVSTGEGLLFCGNQGESRDECEIVAAKMELPLCLRTRCNQEKYAVEIFFGDSVHTCAVDGETVDLPDAPGTVIYCPRLALVCPELICPFNCAGRGMCDYSLDRPRCICNDAHDPSPGCLNSPRFTMIKPLTNQVNSVEDSSMPAQESCAWKMTVLLKTSLVALVAATLWFG